MSVKNNISLKIINTFFILITFSIGIYFYSEFKMPGAKVDSAKTPTSLEKVKELQVAAPPTNLVKKQKVAQTDSLYYNTNPNDPVSLNMKSQTIQIKPHADLKSLNKDLCQKEIFKSALFSYRLKQYSVFGSTLHCISTVLKLSKDDQIKYHQLLGAAGKQQPQYDINGTIIDLSEKNLVKLSQ